MRYKGIKFKWLSLFRRNSKRKIFRTVLPTGATVKRERSNGVENITVTSPETVGPINMDVVRNMHVIDPVYVHPTKPSFFISEEPVNTRGSWKSN
ncbi:MAG TPA: hypothetical protein VFD35_06015 [Pricia sp.]|nr:hypothetical protein [Pricia sp.]